MTYEEFGGPEVLRLTEIEEPHAGPGQVRLKVMAVGVNPFDAKVRSGAMQWRMPVAFPAVPGIEAAGVVDEIGDGVTGSVSVQLAVARGATVIGTASETNHEYLRSLGAIPLAYGDGLADRVRAASPQGIDAVLDAAGHNVLEVSIALRGGTTDRIVTIADLRAHELGVTYSTGPRHDFGPALARYAQLAADDLGGLRGLSLVPWTLQRK